VLSDRDADDRRPPRRLVDGELELRPLERDDAPSLDAAIRVSVDHLRPFMPWATVEPLGLAERARMIDEWCRHWDDGDEFPYAMFVDDEVVGCCGLHPRIGPGGIEIGYWVRVDRIGAGIATRAARLLTDAAFSMPTVEHVEIHHDLANVRSGRVPAKLGYTKRREVADHISAPGEVGISVEWRLERDDWTRRQSTADVT